MKENTTETHPFGDFVPPNANILIVGSYPGKLELGNDWFYSSKRNQFWPIMEGIYNTNLKNKSSKQKLFSKLSIALVDIIRQCKRTNDSNLDNNLTNIVYNTETIEDIIRNNKPEKIIFTSRFVENKFKKLFGDLMADYPETKLVYLPSPSPRYAGMSFKEKLNKYKKVLPKDNYF